MSTHPKTGILLLNMGGPDTPDDVGPFLYNLFSDPDIIKLPLSFIFQKPLAWMIVNSRLKEAKANYAKMPQWNGGSPQLPMTKKQAQSLKANLFAQLDENIPVYIAMRYWFPFTDNALEEIKKDGIEHLIVVTLYPHFSYTTTGSSLNELKRRLKAHRMDSLKLSIVGGYCKDADYINALAQTMRDPLHNSEWTCHPNDVHILFSAHSLPVKHVERTKDPYPKLIEQLQKTMMYSVPQWVDTLKKRRTVIWN